MVISIPQLLSVLRREYGDPHWWPGDTAFEVAVGAILTQRASWTNAEAAIKNLKQAGMLAPSAIAGAPLDALEKLIRPSGFYTQKARYLKSFSKSLLKEHGGTMEGMKSWPTTELRAGLLDLDGIGPETADSILLYALGRPSFVVDAYTYRLMARLGYDELGDYDSLRSMFEQALGRDVKALSDMHALIVVHCKEKCRKTPDCRGCVLSRVCPSKREQ